MNIEELLSMIIHMLGNAAVDISITLDVDRLVVGILFLVVYCITKSNKRE